MRNLFVLFAAIALSACGYSPAVVENAYDNLGSRYATELKQLGDFDDQQKAGIDDFADRLHQWHRANRLPAYAELVGRLGGKLAEDDRISDDDLLDLIRMISLYPHFHEATDTNRELAALATTLSDEQVDQLKQTVHEELGDYREQLLAMSPDALQREQVRYVNNILAFFGVTLSKSQLDLIRSHSGAFHDQRNDQLSAMDQWHEELIDLLSVRHRSDFAQRFVAHMGKDNEYVQLVERSPERTGENDQLAITMLQDLLASLSNDQQAALIRNLKSLGATLTEMTRQ